MTPLTNPIIDCDLHCISSLVESQPGSYFHFVPEAHRSVLSMKMHGSPGAGYVNPVGVHRRDCLFETPAQIEAAHLDRYGITYAVLQPQPGMYFSAIHSIDIGNILCKATNDWLIATYLNRDPRYLGSICVNMNDPLAAAHEIKRVGAHPQMVQVLAPGEAIHLYGHRSYHPVYQACAEEGLVFALHPGIEGAYHSSTPVGRPSSYFEWHNSLPLTFMAHANSLVVEGTFEKFPGLKVLLTEGGYSWLPHLMWRMDKNFKALRCTTPWLKDAPSAYIRRHIKLTTQPIEETDNPRHLLAMLEMVGAEHALCYSSDFPHWDFDDPVRAFPSVMPDTLRQRILWDNAVELYGSKLAKHRAAQGTH